MSYYVVAVLPGENNGEGQPRVALPLGPYTYDEQAAMSRAREWCKDVYQTEDVRVINQTWGYPEDVRMTMFRHVCQEWVAENEKRAQLAAEAQETRRANDRAQRIVAFEIRVKAEQQRRQGGILSNITLN